MSTPRAKRPLVDLQRPPRYARYGGCITLPSAEAEAAAPAPFAVSEPHAPYGTGAPASPDGQPAGALPPRRATDHAMFLSLLRRHGPYAPLFLRRRLWERAARPPARRAGRAIEDGQGVPATLARVRAAVDEAVAREAAGLNGDPAAREVLSGWLRQFGAPRRCVLCDREFQVSDLPGWAYFGAGGYKRCCLQCRILAAPDRRRLIDLIPAFVHACGFVPCADAGPVTNGFTSRIRSRDWPTVMRLYAAMGGTANVKRQFGSWFRGLALSGALPDGGLVTKRGVRCLARDGHVCHSLEEQRIDDWLHGHRIRHEREPRYPWHPQWNPRRNRFADWRVGETYVEYFGLAGEKGYDRRTREKLELARASELPLLALYPEDLENLAECFAALRP